MKLATTSLKKLSSFGWIRQNVCFTENTLYLPVRNMVISRVPSIIRVGVVSCLIVSFGASCQQPAGTVSPPDDAAAATANAAAGVTPDSNDTKSVPPTNETAAEADTPSVTTDVPSHFPEADMVAETAASVDLAAYAELQCSASAYVADTDPTGLNVRGGPGSEFEVIDVLPTDGPVEVAIASSVNEWLQLNVAWSLAQQELEEPGWVYAPLLGVTTRNNDAANPDAAVPLFSEPDAAAEVTAELPQFAEVSLISCSGDWLQVQSGETTGWLADENQCSNPVTTCP